MQPTQVASSLPEFFYDLLGIFTPGIYFFISVYFLYPEPVASFLDTEIIHPLLTALLLSYLIGYLLYSVSSSIVAKPFAYFLGQPAQFLLLDGTFDRYRSRHIRLFMGTPSSLEPLASWVTRGLRSLLSDPAFSISRENVDVVYELCRNFVMERSARRAVSIRKEQAYGEMCRAVVLVSGFSLAALCIASLVPSEPVIYLVPQILSQSLFFLAFSFRYAQARVIGPYFIYTTFVIMALSDLNPAEEGATEDAVTPATEDED